MRYAKVLLIVLIFFFGLIFFIQNTQIFTDKLALSFNLFGLKWTSSPIPLYLYILLAFVIGALVSMLYLLLDKIRMKKELKGCKTKIRSLEKELNELRNMPLNSEGFGQQPAQRQTES